jgi:2-oxoglutarate ferredoxin oxidoreductase subunit delta
MTRPAGTVDIAEELCKGCDLCVVVCPEHVLAMTTRTNRKGWCVVELVGPGCTGCTLCADVCPDGVFTVFRDKP